MPAVVLLLPGPRSCSPPDDGSCRRSAEPPKAGRSDPEDVREVGHDVPVRLTLGKERKNLSTTTELENALRTLIRRSSALPRAALSMNNGLRLMRVPGKRKKGEWEKGEEGDKARASLVRTVLNPALWSSQ